MELVAKAEHGTSADSMEGAQMLRRSLVALMMGVIFANTAMSDDTAPKKPNPAPTGVIGWFRDKTAGLRSDKPSAARSATASKGTGSAKSKSARNAKSNPAGVERAVVNDAERQAVQIRQTAGRPQDVAEETVVVASAAPLQQTPVQPAVPNFIQDAPVLPNTSTVSGPQYFSATPTGSSNPLPVHPSGNWQSYSPPAPVQASHAAPYWTASNARPTGPVYSAQGIMSSQNGMYPQNGNGVYPQTGAALYPAPVPGIPQQVGVTAIMNPAFHPHEYLYPHRYRALYPPYYYKVNGGWVVTPFGVWSHEDWHLKGTQVDVKYKSHISPLSGFHRPVIR
ncbi:MAG: hypothetical protein ACK58L_15560 [Planctomycetota bacterium]